MFNIAWCINSFYNKLQQASLNISEHKLNIEATIKIPFSIFILFHQKHPLNFKFNIRLLIKYLRWTLIALASTNKANYFQLYKCNELFLRINFFTEPLLKGPI